MGGLGDHVGEIIYILLGVLFIVAVMVIATALNKTSKKSTNQKINELNQQVAAVDDQFFEEWDQGVASGAQLKTFMAQAKNKDCAVLVGTLNLFGTEPAYSGITAVTGDSETSVNKSETTFNGAALVDGYNKQLPMVQIGLKDGGSPHKVTDGAFPLATALGTKIKTPALINYGSILKNAVTVSGEKGEKYESTLFVDGKDGKINSITLTTSDFDDSVDFGQQIGYLDGRFYTKLDFATGQNGQILTYNNISDWNNSGKTMNISDGAQFKTYVLQHASGNYLGVVFIQVRGR